MRTWPFNLHTATVLIWNVFHSCAVFEFFFKDYIIEGIASRKFLQSWDAVLWSTYHLLMFISVHIAVVFLLFKELSWIFQEERKFEFFFETRFCFVAQTTLLFRILPQRHDLFQFGGRGNNLLSAKWNSSAWGMMVRFGVNQDLVELKRLWFHSEPLFLFCNLKVYLNLIISIFGVL